jgi:hypothetical protein
VPDYVVTPLVGVGPVKLGMAREAVLKSMQVPSNPFRKRRSSPHETDSFHGASFQVFYSGDEPRVEYIELSRSAELRVLLRDLDVFASTAEHVAEAIAREAPYDPSWREFPYAYIFRSLQLSLWRPVVPSSASDTEGRYFSTIGIGAKGYYNDVA